MPTGDQPGAPDAPDTTGASALRRKLDDLTGAHIHPVTDEAPEPPVRHDVRMNRSLSSYRLPYPTSGPRPEGGVSW